MPTTRVSDSDRHRCPKACETCKRRKERCDGAQPCHRCVTRGVHMQCEYRVRSSRSAVQRQSFRSKSADISALELLPVQILHDTTANTLAPASTGLDMEAGQLFGEQTASSVTFPHLPGLFHTGKGGFAFIGDSANLSFLEHVRRLIRESLGSCPFVDDSLDYMLVESFPDGRFGRVEVEDPPRKPSAVEVEYLIRWYTRATNCIFNGMCEASLRSEVIQWLEGSSYNAGTSSATYYLVLAIGAQMCPEDKDDLAEEYFRHGRLLTMSLLTGDPSIASVQCHILMTMYLLGASRKNAAYMSIGIATRAAYALGIHRQDVATSLNLTEKTIRERLWKALRKLDLFISASLGRPPSTSETRDTNAQGGYSATNDLCAIFETVLTEVYTKHNGVSVDLLKPISERHRLWSSRLRDGLVTDLIQPEESHHTDTGKLPNIGLVNLKEAYYWTIMLLARPLLLRRVSKHIFRDRSRVTSKAVDRSGPQLSSSSDTILVHACIDSAIRTLDLLQDLLSCSDIPKRLPFAVDSIFCSSLTLTIAFFGDLDQIFPLEKGIRVAQALLHKFQPHDPLARRYLAIVDRLRFACDDYIERRARGKMECQGRLVGELFGRVHETKPTSRIPTKTDMDALAQATQQQETESILGASNPMLYRHVNLMSVGTENMLANPLSSHITNNLDEGNNLVLPEPSGASTNTSDENNDLALREPLGLSEWMPIMSPQMMFFGSELDVHDPLLFSTSDLSLLR